VEGLAGILAAALFFVAGVEEEQIEHLTLMISLFFFMGTKSSALNVPGNKQAR
jgi:hypothetical protein